MAIKALLDQVVAAIKNLGPECKLSGDDSDLSNVWEEYKFQVQHEKSFYWEAYVATTIQICAAVAASIPDLEILDIWLETANAKRKGAKPPDIGKMREDIQVDLLKRLVAKAKMEKINFKKPDFQFCYYPGPGFIIYAQVLDRTGPRTIRVRAYSVATFGSGEEGDIYLDNIEGLLTKSQFEKCCELGWPETRETLESKVLEGGP
jgi:hypothetical protein